MSNTMTTFFDLYKKGEASGGEFFEQIIEKTYRHVLKNAMRAIDCGASVGRHTIPMSECVGPSGQVFAIEPIPQLAQKLKKLCPTNVEIISAALGNVSRDDVDFFYVKHGVGHGLSALENPDKHPAMQSEWANSIEVIQVPQCTLDELVPVSHKIRFIKMDLEGGEFNALEGARKTILRDRPFIIFENGSQYSATTYHYNPEQFFDLFFEYRYLLFDLFGRQFTRDQWNQPGYPWYLIAVSKFSTDEKYMRESHSDIVQAMK